MICDHQLGPHDNSGWLLSSSASAPVGGSTSTAQILKSIIADELLGDEEDKADHPEFLQSKSIQLSVAKEREGKYKTSKESRVALARSKVDYFHDFSNFDESEHLDGCPVKWLFRRQTSENWKSRGFQTKNEEGEARAKKKSGTRDKVPKEIKIKKLGLKKRHNKYKHLEEEVIIEEDVDDSVKLLNQQKRSELAAKLNFKMFDSEEEDSSEEEERTLSNFLPPRPLTGQKPWLCVLLAPRTECCFLPKQKRHITELDRCRSPSMSVRSLTFPEIPKARPKTTPPRTAAARWAGKKVKMPHTVRLEATKVKPEEEECSEQDSKEEEANLLLIEDKYYRLKRFLNLEDVASTKEETMAKEKPKKKKKKRKEKISSEGSIEIVSSRVQFFERPGKPMR